MDVVGVYRGEIAGLAAEVKIHSERLFLDTLSPVGIFEQLNGFSHALLESADPESRFSRFSFVCGKPLVEFAFKDGLLRIDFRNGKKTVLKTNDPLLPMVLISSFNSAFKHAKEGFFGGVVGYLSYEAYKYFEPASISKHHESPFDESYFVVPEFVIAFDHLTSMATLYLTELEVEKEPLNSESIVDFAATLKGRFFEETLPKSSTPIRPESFGRAISTFTYEEFIDAVLRAKEYIFEGDAYQIVLSQRFSYPKLVAPFQLYRYLRISNPSPYMYFFPSRQLTLVGASPESMLKCVSGVATTRPIAGTRKRGRTAEEDRMLEADMLSDEKELCEHTMLVDLARNDFYRVCKTGTVELVKKFEVERYSHVMHIVSEVRGELREDLTAVDALKSVFPAGTVSGAPKIRASQIITELESCARGPYAGAFGYLNFNGDMDTCIIIRTAFVDNKRIHVQAGAGIVRDSIPENEYLEVVNKAKGILDVLEKGVAERAPFN